MWRKFLDFLKGQLADIFRYLDPLAREIAKAGGILLLRAAAEAVRAAEQRGGSGEEKLKFARHYVIDYLQTNSLPVVAVAINGAIEAAVAALKGGANGIR